MSFADELAALKASMKGASIPLSVLCGRAGIAPSTFTRWQAGNNDPQLRTWERVKRSAEELIQEAKRSAASDEEGAAA